MAEVPDTGGWVAGAAAGLAATTAGGAAGPEAGAPAGGEAGEAAPTAVMAAPHLVQKFMFSSLGHPQLVQNLVVIGKLLSSISQHVLRLGAGTDCGTAAGLLYRPTGGCRHASGKGRGVVVDHAPLAIPANEDIGGLDQGSDEVALDR